MISVGLLITIVVLAGAMPFIGKFCSIHQLSAIKLYFYCILLFVPGFYLLFFFQGVWESYKGNPVFPVWGSSFVNYFPDVGALLIGWLAGSFFAFLVYLSMKSNSM